MTKNNKNNFSENAKMFMNPEYFTETMKKMPTMDFTKVLESTKKQGKTMEHAAQLASKNFQTLVRKYGEMAQNHANASLQLVQNMTSSSNPEEAMAHQQEYLKNAVDRVINNTREMIDFGSESAMEIFNNVTSNLAENLNESFYNAFNGQDSKK